MYSPIPGLLRLRRNNLAYNHVFGKYNSFRPFGRSIFLERWGVGPDTGPTLIMSFVRTTETQHQHHGTGRKRDWKNLFGSPFAPQIEKPLRIDNLKRRSTTFEIVVTQNGT